MTTWIFTKNKHEKKKENVTLSSCSYDCREMLRNFPAEHNTITAEALNQSDRSQVQHTVKSDKIENSDMPTPLRGQTVVIHTHTYTQWSHHSF